MIPRIIVDTREQCPLRPFVWRNRQQVYLPTVSKKVDVGDYSIEGLEDVVAVERKALGDLYGTLYGSTVNAMGERRGNQDRFRDEMCRMRKHARRWLVIEGHQQDLENYMLARGSRVDPSAAKALIASICADFDVSLLWLGSAENCAEFLGVAFSRIIEQMTNVKAANKARARGLDMPWLMPF